MSTVRTINSSSIMREESVNPPLTSPLTNKVTCGSVVLR
jgi:hypothetical protein